MAGNPCCCPEG